MSDINRKISFLFVFFIIVCISFLSGLREELNIGTDTINYLNFFSSLTHYNLVTDKFEVGFVLLSRFISFFTSSGYIYLSTLSFLGLFFVFLFFKKTSPLPIYSFIVFALCYSYSLYFGQIRQGIALPIVLYAIYALMIKDNVKQFILFLLLSCFFHVSSLIVILLICIRKIKLKYLFFMAMFSFLFVFYDISSLFVYFDNLVSSFFGRSFIINKITNYLSGDNNEQFGFSLIQLLYILNICVFMYFNYALKTRNGYFEILLKIYFFGVALNFICNSFPILIRMTYPFLVFEYIIQAYIIVFTKGKLFKSLLFIVFLLVSVVRFYVGFNK